MSGPIDTAKRCPWCLGHRHWVWDKGVPGKFAVACSNPNCAATGPLADSLAIAITLWNDPPRTFHKPHRRLAVNDGLQAMLDDLNPPEAEQDLKPDGRHRL